MNENKTIAEVYEEVVKSPELQKEFLAAQKNGTIAEFAAQHGCKATAEEVEAFLKEKLGEDKELSLDDLEQVAGGGAKAGRKCPNCGNTVWGHKTGQDKFEDFRMLYLYKYHCNNCGNDFERWEMS